MPEGSATSSRWTEVGRGESRRWRTGRERDCRHVAWCPLCTKASLLVANILCFLAAAMPRGNCQSMLLEDPNLPSTSGFFSIDCGYDGLPYRNGSNLTWTQDQDFSSGTAARQYTFPVGTTVVKMLETLRYFSQGRRNCYNISVAKPGKYLVRLTFWYNNYDGQGEAPTFNVSVGSTHCGTIVMSTGSILQPEYIVNSEVSFLLICLFRVYQNPIISGIEIRPLPNDSYKVDPELGYLPSSVLWGLYRLSCGGSIDVGKYGYPEDPFDRIWQVDVNNVNYGSEYNILPLDTLIVTAKKNVSGSNVPPNYPPELLLKTGRSPLGKPELNYTFNYITPGTYQIFLYFAEVDDNVTSLDKSRIMNFYVNDQLVAESIDVKAEARGYYKALTKSWSRPVGAESESLQLSFVQSGASSSVPLINGIEVYRVRKGPTATDPVEVEAMLAIRDSLSGGDGYLDWVADPCWPIEWTGVSCYSTSLITRVYAISVTSANLTGIISPFVGNISTLKQIILSDNQIGGQIPASIGNLQYLEILRLHTNELEGSIPASLRNLLRLKELDLSSNDLNGTVPFNSTNFNVATVVLTGNSNLCSETGQYNLPWCSRMFIPPPSSPHPPPHISPPPPEKVNPSIFSAGLITGVVASGVIVAIAIVMVVVLCLLRVKRPQGLESGINGLTPPSMTREGGDWLKPFVGLPPAAVVPRVTGARQFTLEELRDATGAFSLSNQIGVGGFGIVFKGILAGGKVVAVKKRIGTSLQGQKEFYNEVELLSRVHHRHLVGLVGFCNDSGQQILVYDYMLNGTVRDHLYDLGGKPLGRLDWQRRLSIAVGAAKGIEYLHTGSNPCIIHRDIKTSNILLDENYEAKVADFGLSKLGPEGGESHVSTMVKGTAGYLDPEYYTIQQLTDRSDVYSFGVVLLELICGREPINLNRSRPEWSLVEWVRPNLQQGNLQGILDPTLDEHEYSLDAMWKVAEVGILCVEPAGQNRPSISDVLRELKEAMEMEGFSIRDSLGSSQHNQYLEALSRTGTFER